MHSVPAPSRNRPFFFLVEMFVSIAAWCMFGVRSAFVGTFPFNMVRSHGTTVHSRGTVIKYFTSLLTYFQNHNRYIPVSSSTKWYIHMNMQTCRHAEHADITPTIRTTNKKNNKYSNNNRTESNKT